MAHDPPNQRAQDDDRVVISAVLAGDIDAFDTLMSRYERLVFKVAYGITRQHDDALDVCQVAFLKAYNSLDSFRGGSSCKSWLARIAYNEGLNWLRRHRRHRVGRQEVEVVDQLPPSDRPVALSSQVVPEAVLLERERDSLLERSIDALKPRYRMAMILRYQEGLSVRDVADAMACTEGNAKSLLFRGVRMLRDLIEVAESSARDPGARRVLEGSLDRENTVETRRRSAGPRGLVRRGAAPGDTK